MSANKIYDCRFDGEAWKYDEVAWLTGQCQDLRESMEAWRTSAIISMLIAAASVVCLAVVVLGG